MLACMKGILLGYPVEDTQHLRLCTLHALCSLERTAGLLLTLSFSCNVCDTQSALQGLGLARAAEAGDLYRPRPLCHRERGGGLCSRRCQGALGQAAGRTPSPLPCYRLTVGSMCTLSASPVSALACDPAQCMPGTVCRTGRRLHQSTCFMLDHHYFANLQQDGQPEGPRVRRSSAREQRPDLRSSADSRQSDVGGVYVSRQDPLTDSSRQLR